MFEGLSEKIGVSGCQLFDKVGCRQGGFAFAYHGNAVFFGEVFRVDVVAAVHEHLFDVDLLLRRVFHRVVPIERTALDGKAVLGHQRQQSVVDDVAQQVGELKEAELEKL